MISNDTALDRRRRVSEHLAALAQAAEAADELTPVVAGWAERLARGLHGRRPGTHLRQRR